MQAGQVSIWVPIVVGVIGLVGVIAGQLVSAWREDRRWTREQMREDMRWQRESEKEQRNRETADRAHWRDRKFEIYNDLLSFMKRWRSIYQRLATILLREDSIEPDLLFELNAFVRESSEHCDKIELIATDRDAQSALLDTVGAYKALAEGILEDKFPVDMRRDMGNEFAGASEVAIPVIIAAIRIDLGISDSADIMYLAS